MIDIFSVIPDVIYVTDCDGNVFRDYNNFFDYHIGDDRGLEELLKVYDVTEKLGIDILHDNIKELRQRISNLNERIDYLENKEFYEN